MVSSESSARRTFLIVKCGVKLRSFGEKLGTVCVERGKKELGERMETKASTFWEGFDTSSSEEC